MRVHEVIDELRAEYESKIAGLLDELRQERMRVSLLNLANVQMQDRLAARDRALDLSLADAKRWRFCEGHGFPREITTRDGRARWAIDVGGRRCEFASADAAADAAAAAEATQGRL